jgi:hypothetical protein
VTADQNATGGAVGAGTATQANAGAALRVVRGEPTAEELAALVAVLAARSAAAVAAADGAGAQQPAGPVSGWTDRARYVRAGRPGFGAWTGWRASALPR